MAAIIAHLNDKSGCTRSRAGEHGKGFGVVADEVRKLAVTLRRQQTILSQV